MPTCMQWLFLICLMCSAPWGTQCSYLIPSKVNPLKDEFISCGVSGEYRGELRCQACFKPWPIENYVNLDLSTRDERQIGIPGASIMTSKVILMLLNFCLFTEPGRSPLQAFLPGEHYQQSRLLPCIHTWMGRGPDGLSNLSIYTRRIFQADNPKLMVCKQ